MKPSADVRSVRCKTRRAGCDLIVSFVIFSLEEDFLKLFYEVTMCVSKNKDNHGTTRTEYELSLNLTWTEIQQKLD